MKRGDSIFTTVLSRHPPSLAVEEELLDHTPRTDSTNQRVCVKSAKQAFLRMLAARMNKATTNLAETQRRYKRNYDDRIRSRLKCLQPGDFVFREIPEHPVGVNPKLA